MGNLILISGKNDSGKSRFAESLIRRIPGERFYIAAMRPCTGENYRRIEAHRRQRQDMHFQTLELPFDVDLAAVTPDSVVLLEDVSNLLANLFFERGEGREEALREIQSLADRCRLLFVVTISGLMDAADAATRSYIRELNDLNASLRELSACCVEMADGRPEWQRGSEKEVLSGFSFPLRLQNLTAGYRGKPVTRDVTVEIRRGEILTLIGPNGAGKSTILKTISRQLERISGSVVILGRELRDYKAQELARTLSVVLTQQVHPERMTCREVVSSGRDPYSGRLGILSEADRQKVGEMLELFDLTEFADREFEAVSDGQRQRVLIARALCQDPEILVMDEPTSYLDIRYKLEFLSTLRRLTRERGLTAVMSLHEIDLAAKCSDRLLCVGADGRVLIETPESLSEGERLRELFHAERGTVDSLLGTLELPRPEGEARVLVLSAGGSGIPVYRKLQRMGIPFAAGILYENDIDFRAAEALSSEVISERPFLPIRRETLARAVKVLQRCEVVLDAGFPVGEINRGMQELREEAARGGKLVRSADEAERRLKERAEGKNRTRPEEIHEN